MKDVIFSAEAPAAIGPYSQAIRAGGVLYLSGQIGMNPASGELVSQDVREQAARAIQNMKAVLAAAGATPEQVVKTTVFLTDMADFQAVNSVYAETFKSVRPRTFLCGRGLSSQGQRVWKLKLWRFCSSAEEDSGNAVFSAVFFREHGLCLGAVRD